MKKPQFIHDKIIDLAEMMRQTERLRYFGKSIVFTNGCFDILHSGHIASLTQAAIEADYLVVGLNADKSVRKLKGAHRPINDQQSRALLLASLVMTDAIVIFEEDTPLELISLIMPDVLVKGGDYSIDEIVGAKQVLAAGGRVVINPLLPGFSTSALIEKIHRL